MSSSSRTIDRVAVTFDDPTLVADAGLIVPVTLMVRLGLEALVNRTVRLSGRVGGARPGRKVSKGQVVQYVGRVLRGHPGKNSVEVHDYVDQRVPVLAYTHTKRCAGYASLGFPDPTYALRS